MSAPVHESIRMAIELDIRAAHINRLRAVHQAAKAYRAEEVEGTSRLWRGKKLHDLGLALDEAIAAYERVTPMQERAG